MSKNTQIRHYNLGVIFTLSNLQCLHGHFCVSKNDPLRLIKYADFDNFFHSNEVEIIVLKFVCNFLSEIQYSHVIFFTFFQKNANKSIANLSKNTQNLSTITLSSFWLFQIYFALMHTFHKKKSPSPPDWLYIGILTIFFFSNVDIIIGKFSGGFSSPFFRKMPMRVV